MDIHGWDERYRAQAHAEQDFGAPPTQLVMETASKLSPGKALDLACGTGRNALWLASTGWDVTAIDGSSSAIEIVRGRARDHKLTLIAQVDDLLSPSFPLHEAQWDLVTICYYLQPDLIERAKCTVKPGGILIVIVHITEADEQPTQSRLRPGELEQFFRSWEVLHRYEGKPNDPSHRRMVAEIVVRRPEASSAVDSASSGLS